MKRNDALKRGCSSWGDESSTVKEDRGMGHKTGPCAFIYPVFLESAVKTTYGSFGDNLCPNIGFAVVN